MPGIYLRYCAVANLLCLATCLLFNLRYIPEKKHHNFANLLQAHTIGKLLWYIQSVLGLRQTVLKNAQIVLAIAISLNMYYLSSISYGSLIIL